MSSTGPFYWLSQLGYSAPFLVVYLVAFVLALVYRKRAPRASTLTLAGVAILVFSTLAGFAMQAYLFHSMTTGQHVAWTSQMMGIAGFAATCARAAGLSLLVAAIFAGRGPGVSRYREPDAPRPEDEPRRGDRGEAGLFRSNR